MNVTPRRQIAPAGPIAWNTVTRAGYALWQRYAYSYPAPVRDLRQTLVAIPRDHYAGQRLVESSVEVDLPATVRRRDDDFGNTVVEVDVPLVDSSVAFEVAATVERASGVTLTVSGGDRYLAPTPLTLPDETIRTQATAIATGDPATFATAVRDWVADTLAYTPGATSVKTTAAEALTLGRGVCQDYSHLMIAICRAAGIPARYVSGHLLGEGASHAWVEVILPDGTVAAHDPTNRRVPHLGYVTLAVGRDYRDVAPTSGRYRAKVLGILSASKRFELSWIETMS